MADILFKPGARSGPEGPDHMAMAHIWSIRRLARAFDAKRACHPELNDDDPVVLEVQGQLLSVSAGMRDDRTRSKSGFDCIHPPRGIT